MRIEGDAPLCKPALTSLLHVAIVAWWRTTLVCCDSGVGVGSVGVGSVGVGSVGGK